MDAPKCRICGERHWSRLCVTPDVTRDVTRDVTVTKPVTCQQCERLRAEIVDLTSSLAQSQRLVAELRKLLKEAVPKLAMSGAERVRNHRQRKKA
jgi:hypothetical protein